MNGILSILNGNKILWAVTMLIFNVGSRFVLADISEGREHLLTSAVFKRLVVFSMFFVATRDVALSVVLTVAFILVFNVLLRPDVDIWCLVPKSSRCNESRPIPAASRPPPLRPHSSAPSPLSSSSSAGGAPSSAVGGKHRDRKEETFVSDEMGDDAPPPLSAAEDREVHGTMINEVVTSLAFAPL